MAKDFIHEAIVTALENDGWFIHADPFRLDLEEDDTFFNIDLAATKPEGYLVSKKDLVAIEIKSFISGSVLNAFHEALGQYLNYKAAIEEQKLETDLFLAILEEGWDRISSVSFIQRRILQYNLKFIIVDIYDKKITSWRN